MNNRRVRDIQVHEFDLVIDYFLNSDEDHLRGMGVEPARLPDRDQWRQALLADCGRPLEKRQNYYVIWELNGKPVGHSNINEIFFGLHASMHLHLWQPETRHSGNGTFFLRQSITRYFETFQLQNLFCEPYAHNPAPNRTLAKVGFELIKTYETQPGWICFHQEVNRWRMTRKKWLPVE
ncbi:MAG: GNAT family protein [Candidatus Promineifilaceae bacterium]|nr:GNAT family protein [Candidatus Promineifilaceae bacterium]